VSEVSHPLGCILVCFWQIDDLDRVGLEDLRQAHAVWLSEQHANEAFR